MESDSGKNSSDKRWTRREVIRAGLAGVAGVGLVGVGVMAPFRREGDEWVWQLDPQLCVQCEGCAENCVKGPSAVKCVHAFDMCGY